MTPAAIDWEHLRREAVAVARTASAPYSGLQVGAVAVCSDGRTVTGCNVENASYGLTLCAECGVVSALHASGGGRLVATVVRTASGDPLMPCGRCRQLLWEAGGPELLVDGDGTPRLLSALLPGAFDETALGDTGPRAPAGHRPARVSKPATGAPPAAWPLIAPRAGGLKAVDVIRAKRDGGSLSDEQIRWFIDGYTRGQVADEQAAALCMAVFWRGLNDQELATWTAAMVESGARLDLSGVSRPTVDKHSTGGVGDKVSLVLVPLVIACGAAVPQISGRGLGHTGGTLDKMESIPGWHANLSNERMIELLDDLGGFIASASSAVAPADRKLYALRDVTATVESIPLIASSIMSKKIAEGTSALVLDVKFGSGAFLPDPDQGRRLAETMVAIGERAGVKTVAYQTSMATVLGRAAGNALEVAEAVETLAGGGPDDLREVTVTLAREMCELAGVSADPEAILASGGAMDIWRAMVRAQGGDPSAALPVAPEHELIRADRSGVLARLDCRAVGVAAWRLGAGRARKEDPVSPIAGVVGRAKPGDQVSEGEPVLELHIDDPDRVDDALAALRDAVRIADEAEALPPLILDRVAAT